MVEEKNTIKNKFKEKQVCCKKSIGSVIGKHIISKNLNVISIE